MNKALYVLLAGCCTIAAARAGEHASFGHGESPNGMLYPRDSRPFDKRIHGWADRSVQWMYAQPFDRSPFFDTTGAHCAVDQHGPVWFLAPIASAAPGYFTRFCTVPRGKSILLMAMDISETFPCPDPNFEPAPGQSLYDFLVADSNTFPKLKTLVITLDGRPVYNTLDYHYISENLFSLKGDPSLTATFDGCITGAWQPALSNGYFYMFRPLAPGVHTIVRRSTGDSGMVNSFTYYITVR